MAAAGNRPPRFQDAIITARTSRVVAVGQQLGCAWRGIFPRPLYDFQKFPAYRSLILRVNAIRSSIFVPSTSMSI
jgi:hypothetical protein